MSASDLPLAGHRTAPRRPRPVVSAARALVIGLAVTAATVVGTLTVADDTASAVSGPLATNAMAPVVTSSARQALDSYDRWIAGNEASDYRSFVWFRTQAAQYAAIELGYPQDEMVEAWASTPITSEENVGFDCSGLTTFAWSRAGVQLTRQSSAQINEASPLDRASARAGDLVQYPGHVMMYLGVGDAVIHSVQRGRTVELDTINERRTNSVRFGDPTL